MCLFPQYIQQQNLYTKFQQGFTHYYKTETSIFDRIFESDFTEDKKYLKIKRVDKYLNLDTQERFLSKEEALQISKRVVGLYDSDMLDNYMFNPATGEIIPIFIETKCGKCEICQNSKLLVNQNRCLMESQTEGIPFFCRLSFKDEILQNIEESADVTELFQKFLKRLRVNLERAGFEEKLRYIIITEYGSKFGRLHAHALFWFNNEELHRFKQYEKHVAPKFYEFLEKSYQLGQTNCQIAKDVSGKYTMKYMQKQTPNQPIFKKLQSQGLGYKIIEKYKQNIQSNPNTSYFEIYDIYSGKLKRVPLFSYVINKTMPSFCRAIPKEIRDTISSVCYNFARLHKLAVYGKYVDVNVRKLSNWLQSIGQKFETFSFPENTARTAVQILEAEESCFRDMDTLENYFKILTEEEKNEIKKTTELNEEHKKYIMTNLDNTADYVKKQRIIKNLIAQKNKENDCE